VSWVSNDDANGCHLGGGHSGSLQVQASGPEYLVGVTLWADDCLNIQAGQWVHLAITAKAVQDPGGFVEPVIATYLQSNCAGAAGVGGWADDSGSAGGFGTSWSTLRWHGDLLPEVQSIRVGFLPNVLNPTVRFDRVYAGPAPRLFGDDFEAGSTFCRWSSAVVSGDTTPPTNPGPIASSSHDGDPAPPPIQLGWSPSTDSGGSGLRRYRLGLFTAYNGGPIPCQLLFAWDLGTQASSQSDLPPDDYYFGVCAEDNAGNMSEVVVGGPYTVY
jgi:hypothetical protein